MIEHVLDGDILQADVEALVNPVNCVGVMGAGLAAEFKKAYPVNFQDYAKACKRGEVCLGKVHIYCRYSTQFNYRSACGFHLIVNFPTKRHWRDPSFLKDITDGLADLACCVERLNIASIAIPALGCGLGGLDWNVVRPEIEAVFSAPPDVRVLLYHPRSV